MKVAVASDPICKNSLRLISIKKAPPNLPRGEECLCYMIKLITTIILTPQPPEGGVCTLHF